MTKPDYAMYQVTLKILLRRDDTYLTLYTSDDFVDFPGGRIDESEYDVPFVQSMQREFAEELGTTQIAIEDLAFVCKRAYTFTGVVHHVLAVYYNASLEAGDIALSDEHKKYAWLTPSQIVALPPNKFMSGDEYEQMSAYFQ